MVWQNVFQNPIDDGFDPWLDDLFANLLVVNSALEQFFPALPNELVAMNTAASSGSGDEVITFISDLKAVEIRLLVVLGRRDQHFGLLPDLPACGMGCVDGLVVDADPRPRFACGLQEGFTVGAFGLDLLWRLIPEQTVFVERDQVVREVWYRGLSLHVKPSLDSIMKVAD